MTRSTPLRALVPPLSAAAFFAATATAAPVAAGAVAPPPVPIEAPLRDFVGFLLRKEAFDRGWELFRFRPDGEVRRARGPGSYYVARYRFDVRYALQEPRAWARFLDACSPALRRGPDGSFDLAVLADGAADGCRSLSSDGVEEGSCRVGFSIDFGTTPYLVRYRVHGCSHRGLFPDRPAAAPGKPPAFAEGALPAGVPAAVPPYARRGPGSGDVLGNTVAGAPALVGDFDRDGFLDLASAGPGGGVRYHPGPGLPRLVERTGPDNPFASFPDLSVLASSVWRLVDADLDGDLDLLSPTEDGHLYFENLGSPGGAPSFRFEPWRELLAVPLR